MARARTPSTPRHRRLARIGFQLAIGAITLNILQTLALHDRPIAERIAVVEAAPAAVAAPPLDLSVSAGTLLTAPESAIVAVPAPVVAVVPPIWYGTTARDANVRSAPSRTAPLVRELAAGEAIQVSRWVAGDEIEPHNPIWAEIGSGQFVFSTLLRRDPLVAPPVAPDAPTAGKWIDVNLTLQVATAYEGSRAVHWTLISSGAPNWETPTGTERVLRRVEKETMDGSTLIGQGPDGKGASYRVENVRYTQYFTQDGAAIHENSWRDPWAFGMPGSHGCIGMPPTEAAWFWRWTEVGTPRVIHA